MDFASFKPLPRKIRSGVFAVLHEFFFQHQELSYPRVEQMLLRELHPHLNRLGRLLLLGALTSSELHHSPRLLSGLHSSAQVVDGDGQKLPVSQTLIGHHQRVEKVNSMIRRS